MVPESQMTREFEPCCECGQDYPGIDLAVGYIYCAKCRALPENLNCSPDLSVAAITLKVDGLLSELDRLERDYVSRQRYLREELQAYRAHCQHETTRYLPDHQCNECTTCRKALPGDKTG